jgi:hypothetical protein
MSDTPQKPLPFIYQFAAGAVAGVSEVCRTIPIARVICFESTPKLHAPARHPRSG